MAERTDYAETVGQDGYALLRMLEADEVPDVLATLPRVGILRKIWDHHYRPSEGGKACFVPVKELGPAPKRSNRPMTQRPATGLGSVPVGPDIWLI